MNQPFNVESCECNVSVSLPCCRLLYEQTGRRIEKMRGWRFLAAWCGMTVSPSSGQQQGWPNGRLILISASLSSSSAATSRHFPSGPVVKRWHAQRHIGFHYFHSYESATLDSSRAVMANPGHRPPSLCAHAHTQTHIDTSHQPAHLETPAIRANENELILMWAYDPSPFSQWNVLCNCWLTPSVSIKQLRARHLITLPL